MSVIFSDKELNQIEKLLGKDFVILYEKLWKERNQVKNYREVVKRNIKTGRSAFPPELPSSYSKTYWEYKLGEIKCVLENQSKWLRKVLKELLG